MTSYYVSPENTIGETIGCRSAILSRLSESINHDILATECQDTNITGNCQLSVNVSLVPCFAIWFTLEEEKWNC